MRAKGNLLTTVNIGANSEKIINIHETGNYYLRFFTQKYA